eukprot:CAMPEP_0170542712 /NCGR_PEP_ID=MMETSP0211-20121228/2061_1 /TAXON_ID=311385 /ORGANISM="Pseudokeronopsis sp., Strain OXSARD2" /LENGTH=70 /DNA_ID=CAMNT_0010845869 /DNA_START=72 /DNA_END=284 /DNA_ORIENTATION=+
MTPTETRKSPGPKKKQSQASKKSSLRSAASKSLKSTPLSTVSAGAQQEAGIWECSQRARCRKPLKMLPSL